jgi:hypothetical protein
MCAPSSSHPKQLELRAIATVLFLSVCSGGAVLLDVRLGNKYEACHAAGSLSTPLYNPIQKWDLPSILRRAGFAFFGIYGTGMSLSLAPNVVRLQCLVGWSLCSEVEHM